MPLLIFLRGPVVGVHHFFEYKNTHTVGLKNNKMKL